MMRLAVIMLLLGIAFFQLSHAKKKASLVEISEARRNPCDGTRCRKGEECILGRDSNPICTCASACPVTVDENEMVCGTNNVTYTSVCELLRAKCIGRKRKQTRRSFKRLKIDYYGSCQKIPKCKKRDLREYPTRMRSWIKNTFIQLYDTLEERGGLTREQREQGMSVYTDRYELQRVEEGPVEAMDEHFDRYYPNYVYPIHWKFGQLDRKPKNGRLSKKELEPLRAPLIPMEHCTKLFFKQADENKDKMISFEEWGRALGLKDGETGKGF